MANRYVWNKYNRNSRYVNNDTSDYSIGVDSQYDDVFSIEETDPSPMSTNGRYSVTLKRILTVLQTYKGDTNRCIVIVKKDKNYKTGEVVQVRTVYKLRSSSHYWKYQTSLEIIPISSSIGTDETYCWRRTASLKYSQGSTNYGPVSSADSGAYPSDSSSGSNWYVYQGSDNIDPASVTIPASIQGGTSIDITVAPSTGKKYGGTVSYTYQYKLDNGRWQALSGPTTATTQQLTVPKGTASVQVQVRAQDNLGFTSSTWVASASVEVTNNQPPTAPGSIDVANVVSGQEATITLTAATDPDGSIASYIYQRSVDSGAWQQFAQANTLTQTDTVSNSWGTVQYRACAVDNEGAQGPFATSTIYTVTSGLLVIGGPASSLGELDRQFKLALNINVTGVPSLTDIDVQATLDGASIYTGQVDSGGVATIPVDARVLYTGAHTIRVTVSHDDYEPATAEYTFTVPTVSMPDGGRALVGQTPDGEPAFFYTTSQSVFCQGGTLADVLVTMQGGSAAPLLEPVVKAAPPSGSYALSPGVLYDFTQANASSLTFTFEAPAAGKAAAYHVMFKCGSTAATVNLPDGVRTPDGYVIEANRVYELSILQNMLAYQSWGAS